MIDANPCRDVRKRLLRKEQHKLIPLCPAEVDALAVEMAKKHAPYGLLTKVAAYTGLLAGELHALRKRAWTYSAVNYRSCARSTRGAAASRCSG
jgi:hypothetical protein